MRGFGTTEFMSEVAGEGQLKSSRLCTGRPSNCEIPAGYRQFHYDYLILWSTKPFKIYNSLHSACQTSDKN